MQPINKSRLVLGAIAAGLVLNVIEGVVHGVIFAARDAEMMTRLNLSAATSPQKIIALNIWGFAVGLLTIGLYTALRAGRGPGPATAIRAGVLTWAGVSVLGGSIPAILGISPLDLTLTNFGIELVAMILASLAGAALYKDQPTGTAAAAKA